MDNKLNANEGITINFNAGAFVKEAALIHGHYEAECRDADGNLLWRDGFDNVVTYAGQNQLLLQITGNTTVVGPFMGLIGNNTTGPVVGDTQLSHAGWVEAGNPQTPTYSGSSSGGTLTVTDGTHTAKIALLGNYLASTFVTSSDGHGGTAVVDPLLTSSNQQMLLTQPQHA